MADIESIQARLENVQSVEPIISSMRTIAAGGWRQALRRQQATRLYIEHLSDVLGVLLRHVPPGRVEHFALRPENRPGRTALVLVIASERGLCGAFNDIVLQGAQQLIDQQQIQYDQVVVGALGGRASAFLRARGYELLIDKPLPVTRVASLDLSNSLAQGLISQYVSGQVDAISVVYSPYRPATIEKPILQRWLPVDIASLPVISAAWPEPIIETPPAQMLPHILDEWVYTRLFQFIIESAASEQAARYRAMENASTNLQNMIAELTLSYHSARQNEITMQMLDLAAGSGILAGPRDRHAE